MDTFLAVYVITDVVLSLVIGVFLYTKRHFLKRRLQIWLEIPEQKQQEESCDDYYCDEDPDCSYSESKDY
jgi:hypothetical protein